MRSHCLYQNLIDVINNLPPSGATVHEKANIITLLRSHQKRKELEATKGKQVREKALAFIKKSLKHER